MQHSRLARHRMVILLLFSVG